MKLLRLLCLHLFNLFFDFLKGFIFCYLLQTFLIEFLGVLTQFFSIETCSCIIAVDAFWLIDVSSNEFLEEVDIFAKEIIGGTHAPDIISHHFRFVTESEQLLEANYAEVLCSFIVDKERLEETWPALKVDGWVELIDSVFKGVGVHGAESFADSWYCEGLFANYPKNSQ